MSVWLEGALRQLPNKNPTSGEPYATIQQLEELHQQVLRLVSGRANQTPSLIIYLIYEFVLLCNLFLFTVQGHKRKCRDM